MIKMNNNTNKMLINEYFTLTSNDFKEMRIAPTLPIKKKSKKEKALLKCFFSEEELLAKKQKEDYQLVREYFGIYNNDWTYNNALYNVCNLSLSG
jgi:hypothetical protein